MASEIAARGARPRRKLLAAVCVIAVLGGCAFQPLHRPDGALSEVRGSVAISGVEGREGYAFRQALTRRLGAAGPEPLYGLEVALDFEERGLAITRKDDITRFDVVGRADFTLRERAGGATRIEGVARSVSAYSTLATPYATRIAAQDASRRVAEDLAERVFAQLAASLAAETTATDRVE